MSSDEQRPPDGGGGGGDSEPDTPSRVVIAECDLGSLSAGELASRWRRQDAYVDSIEQRLARQEGR